MNQAGLGPGLGAEGAQPSSLLRLALPAPLSAWWQWFQQSWPEAISYLPVAIPLALATVVGGIDCTESAAAATLLMAGAFAWFGIIHSPLPSDPINAPGAVLRQLSEEGRATASPYQTPYHWAAAYAAMACTVLLLGRFGQRPVIHEADAPRSA